MNEDIYLLVGTLVLLTAQIGCLFSKKIWIRLIPTAIVVLLMGLCVLLYIMSGNTNWGFLILLLLLFILLAAMCGIWLIYGIVYGILKLVKRIK